MEMFLENSEDLCSIKIENETTHMATLQTGIRCCIEGPVTTVEPSHCRNVDSTRLVHPVIHTYHPDITEPNKFHHQDMIQPNNFIAPNDKDQNIDQTKINTIFNVQASQKLGPQVLRFLPYF